MPPKSGLASSASAREIADSKRVKSTAKHTGTVDTFQNSFERHLSGPEDKQDGRDNGLDVIASGPEAGTFDHKPRNPHKWDTLNFLKYNNSSRDQQKRPPIAGKLFSTQKMEQLQSNTQSSGQRLNEEAGTFDFSHQRSASQKSQGNIRQKIEEMRKIQREAIPVPNRRDLTIKNFEKATEIQHKEGGQVPIPELPSGVEDSRVSSSFLNESELDESAINFVAPSIEMSYRDSNLASHRSQREAEGNPAMKIHNDAYVALALPERLPVPSGMKAPG